jgi:hypothetical protein
MRNNRALFSDFMRLSKQFRSMTPSYFGVRSFTIAKIIFQKNYQVQEELDEKTPAGFVKAMSGAIKKLSGNVIADIYSAVSAQAASSPE